MHVINKLEWAEFALAPTWTRDREKKSSAQAAGLRFERRVGIRLQKTGRPLSSGQWIRFEDAYGIHWAQPDFILGDSANQASLTILEAKTTQTDCAFDQLTKCYIPLIKKIFEGVKIRPIQVCKSLSAGSCGRITKSLAEAEELAAEDYLVVWHAQKI